jgi:hypothetical protein
MNVLARNRDSRNESFLCLSGVSFRTVFVNEALITPPQMHTRPVDIRLRVVDVSKQCDADGAAREHNVTLVTFHKVGSDDAFNVPCDCSAQVS